MRVYGKACVAYLSNYSFDFCFVFSLPLPSICSYKKSGGPAVSALGISKTWLVPSHLTFYVDWGSPLTSAQSLDSKRMQCVFTLLCLDSCSSVCTRPRMDESLSLPSSAFISVVMGCAFQCWPRFVCRSMWYTTLRKYTFQNPHFQPCSDVYMATGLYHAV